MNTDPRPLFDSTNVIPAHVSQRSQAFVALRALQKDMYDTAVSKGWWDDPAWAMAMRVRLSKLVGGDVFTESEWTRITDRNKGELIALMHSELSEGLENLRSKEEPDDKIPSFKGIEAELADAIIRIFDFAEHFNYDVIGALFCKAEFNKTRPHKHGGREF